MTSGMLAHAVEVSLSAAAAWTWAIPNLTQHTSIAVASSRFALLQRSIRLNLLLSEICASPEVIQGTAASSIPPLAGCLRCTPHLQELHTAHNTLNTKASAACMHNGLHHVAYSIVQFCCTPHHQELHTAHDSCTLMTMQPACTLPHTRLHALGHLWPSKPTSVCLL